MVENTWVQRAQGVSVSFGDYQAVTDADFTLDASKVTALVGPNGCGKSTLLRSLTRLITPKSGTIELDGIGDITALSSREFARKVGLLAQQRPIPASITVEDIVGYGRHPHRSGFRGRDSDGTAAINRALELTGLTELRESTIETLSGGQQQRAWFASALAQDTDVLLLDEPTNHLDLRYQIETLDLIRELADEFGVAIGVVLHDLNHAAQVADRIVVMRHGHIVADGTPDAALDPELLTETYGIPIRVTVDPDSGALDVRTRPVRRGHLVR